VLDDPEIRDVMEGEKRRGRRPRDIAAERRRIALLKKFREALESGDEERFKQALIGELGQLPGSPEYARSLKIWRDFHGVS